MYEAYFQLNQRPFAATPLVGRYFAAESIEAARKSLVRCIERAEGTGLIVGPAGTGKTLLCYLLAERFKPRFAVAMLFSGNLTTRRELLQAILFELGLPYRGLEEGELRLALIDHLTRGDACPAGMLLIVDEAHTLPLKLLEEVRMITNVVRKGEPRVRLVLAGNPALEEHLASPKLAALSQRLAVRSYLDSMDRDETANYIRSQLAAVGGASQQIFALDALEAIYCATEGIPRLVNQLCDQALLVACSTGKRQVDARTVETAWANLQQLPLPWRSTLSAGIDGSTNTPAAMANVIEFGQLDDGFVDSRLPQIPSLDEGPPAEAAPTLPLLHVAQFDDLPPLDDISPLDEVAGLDEGIRLPSPGESEVELYFDDIEIEPEPAAPAAFDEAAEPSFAAELATTHTPLNSVGAENACALRNEPEMEQFTLELSEPSLSGEDAVIPEDAVEELVVDRYAALDAQKGMPAGRVRRTATNDRPLLPGPVAHEQPSLRGTEHRCVLQEPLHEPAESPHVEPARPLHSAEKNLTLAEALVRQATAVEQAGLNYDETGEVYSILATQEKPPAELSNSWQAVDLFPPGIDDLQAPPPPPVPQLIPEIFSPIASPPAADISGILAESEPPQLMPLCVDLPPAPTPSSPEPDLIVVEDDVPESPLQAAPQVEPVARKEYRQLFARLRKG